MPELEEGAGLAPATRNALSPRFCRAGRSRDEDASGCVADSNRGGPRSPNSPKRGRLAVCAALVVTTVATAFALFHTCGPCKVQRWARIVVEVLRRHSRVPLHGFHRISLSTYGALALSFSGPPASSVAWGVSPSVLDRVARPSWVVSLSESGAAAPPSAAALPLVFELTPRPGEARRISFTLPGEAGGVPHTVVLPPPAGDYDAPLRLALVGDLGSSTASAATLGRMTLAAPHVALLLGDLAYAEKAGAGDCARTRAAWADWDALASPLLSSIPTLAVRGNHDRLGGCEAVDGANGFAELSSRFPAQPLAWWSLAAGAAHIVGLSSSDDVAPGSAQRAWLEADLAAVDRARTPWLILLWHKSWHHSSARHAPPSAMVAHLEPLLLLHGVDAVFMAHVQCVVPRR